jgi:hypothetical protein
MALSLGALEDCDGGYARRAGRSRIIRTRFNYIGVWRRKLDCLGKLSVRYSRITARLLWTILINPPTDGSGGEMAGMTGDKGASTISESDFAPDESGRRRQPGNGFDRVARRFMHYAIHY